MAINEPVDGEYNTLAARLLFALFDASRRVKASDIIGAAAQQNMETLRRVFTAG